MQTVLLFVGRKGIAQTLVKRLSVIPEIKAHLEYDYTNADSAVRKHSADTVLIEASESKNEDIIYCLSVCALLHSVAPSCKLLLLCPESYPKGVAKAIDARKDGVIDDFVFYDASVDYIVSKLLSMQA